MEPSIGAITPVAANRFVLWMFPATMASLARSWKGGPQSGMGIMEGLLTFVPYPGALSVMKGTGDGWQRQQGDPGR